MEAVELKAEVRAVTGKKVRALRREGILPAVVYGLGIDPIPLSLNAHEAGKILDSAGGSTIVNLQIGKDTHAVLVREKQRDVIYRDYLHIDFLKVAMDELITAVVRVELIGEAPAVRNLGGLLVTGLNEIEVEALPMNLPERIEVDITVLKEIEDSINVSDLELDADIAILSDPNELIARIIYAEVEKEPEEELGDLELVGTAEPEVIEKGKMEEEAEE
ncbi:MAG: 50S ribosomal protein L25 [Anaerolineales bacterium]|nr:50S ribosomal protein L25 [Anaerolineales bacterium]